MEIDPTKIGKLAAVLYILFYFLLSFYYQNRNKKILLYSLIVLSICYLAFYAYYFYLALFIITLIAVLATYFLCFVTSLLKGVWGFLLRFVIAMIGSLFVYIFTVTTLPGLGGYDLFDEADLLIRETNDIYTVEAYDHTYDKYGKRTARRTVVYYFENAEWPKTRKPVFKMLRLKHSGVDLQLFEDSTLEIYVPKWDSVTGDYTKYDTLGVDLSTDPDLIDYHDYWLARFKEEYPELQRDTTFTSIENERYYVAFKQFEADSAEMRGKLGIVLVDKKSQQNEPELLFELDYRDRASFEFESDTTVTIYHEGLHDHYQDKPPDYFDTLTVDLTSKNDPRLLIQRKHAEEMKTLVPPEHDSL